MSFAALLTCGYLWDGGWSAKQCEEPEPCPQHSSGRCYGCGRTGVRLRRGCPNAGQFVCGSPLCEDCHLCRGHR